MKFIAIDFETANRYPNSACSVGLVKVENGQIVDELYRLIKPPKMYFEPMNVRIHGIKSTDVLHEPCFDTLWDTEIRDYVEGYPLIAHNASFDMGVLRALFTTFDLSFSPFSYGCTVKAAQRTYRDLPNHKLSTVAESLRIPLRHHQALDDARASALIMLDVLRRHECDSLEALCLKTGICLKLF